METKLQTIKLNFEITLDLQDVSQKFSNRDLDDMAEDLKEVLSKLLQKELGNEPLVKYNDGGLIHYDSIDYVGVSENQESLEDLMNA